jgi:glutamine synthetase
MELVTIRTAEEARKYIEKQGLNYIKVGVFDLDGVLRGKYISKEKFLSALDSGFGFCDVVLGWDTNDVLFDNVTYTGWHSGYPDAPVKLLPETARALPLEDGLLMLADFTEPGDAISPRATLERIVKRAHDLGFEPYCAFEYEFFVFEETPESSRAKGYRDLKPFTPGSFGYSVIRNSVHADLYKDFMDMFAAMNIPIEGLHTETGPGVLEAAITVSDAMTAADNAALFKTFSKVFFQKRGLMPTFMAKWSMQYAGQGGHIHMSLKSKDGKPLFHDDAKEHKMSDLMRSFVAGQEKYMPQVSAMVSPTINSFSRLIPGYWAPTCASWAVDNRTTSLRVIPGSPKSQRVEYRVAASDANPYLALAAALGTGLLGIEEKLTGRDPVKGNAYAIAQPEEYQLPRTLWAAAQNLRQSQAARSLFGDAFVDHFAATREWEEREFRRHITDWELSRYFEII